MLNLRDYQEETLNKLRQGFADGKRAQILYAPTGAGKCLGKGTPVLMADATIKAVENIQVGDKILGPDGLPRNILSLARGREMLHRVTQDSGNPYVVNESHILSLCHKVYGQIKNIPIKEYISSTDEWKNLHFGWRVPNILSGDNSRILTKITVDPIGFGEYYGFELDGDKLFLLGDFTVTHNTEMAIALLSATKTKGNRAAMLLDRIVLCDQTSKRLERYKIDHGVLQSGHWRYRPYENIQVCSAQTLERRGSFPGLSLLIIDECHDQRQQTIEFVKNNPDIKVIGLSATPFTKGLGKTYDNVVSVTTTKKLVDDGVLVPLRVFIAKEIDMTGAKKIAGEWSQAETTTRGMKITGDVVAEWITKTHEIFGEPRKTIVFSSGVDHGADLARKFQEHGYNFISLSYKDDEEWKKQIIEDFSKPDTDIQGLIATDILTKGFDVPDVMIGVSARPFSKSLSSHVQQMGRVMRGYPGKEFALWLDHSGNYLRFREDWDEVYEEGVHKLDDGKEKAKKEPTERQKKESKCPACHALWIGGSDTCYNCGHVRERRNQVSSVAGKMEELSAAGVSRESKQEFWSMMQYFVKHEGWSSGRAANTYREKFGVWPRGLDDVQVKVPSPEVRSFVRKKLYAFLKKIGRK